MIINSSKGISENNIRLLKKGETMSQIKYYLYLKKNVKPFMDYKVLEESFVSQHILKNQRFFDVVRRHSKK